jgi:hypothetical protein
MAKKLKIGDLAPNGLTLSATGEPVELQSLWANGPTLLTFLRHFG